MSDISESAKAAVEAAGGSVEKVYFNRVTLRAHLKPEKFDILPRSNGIPPPKLWKRYPLLTPAFIDRRVGTAWYQEQQAKKLTGKK